MKTVNLVIPVEIPDDLSDDDELIVINSLMDKLTQSDLYDVSEKRVFRCMSPTSGDGWTRQNRVIVHFLKWEYADEQENKHEN